MFAEQVRGEKVLANIEQFMSEKKSFRITNTRGTPQYVDINDGLPENDIIRTKADYVISDQTWNATLRQANFQSLMELAQKLPPNVTIALLDLIVETSDMPNVEELVRRIRQINNQRDPDADPNEVTEEEIAAQKAAEEAAAIQKEDAMADIRKKHADAGFKEAQTKAIADKSVNDKVDAQQKALVAARDAVAAPQTLQIADHILHESGFVSRTDMEEAAEDEMRASQVQAAQAEQEQRAQQEIMQPQDPQMPPEAGGATPEQLNQPLSPTPQQPMEPPLQ